MTKQRPTWLNFGKLSDAASNEAKAKANITVNLPNNFKTLSSYKCNTCYQTLTSGQAEPQLKKAARTGTGYIECPKCSGYLTETNKVIVRDVQKLINRADRLDLRNEPIQRGIHTWIDKAIYGRLIQAVANYCEELGISMPQVRFQRGMRVAKFPGQPMSAKAAEFTVEFTDYNNTRNRIIIEAGLDIGGKFIFPRTFKTLSGNEYPLTALAIEDFTSGKVYDPVAPNHNIPPLNYKAPDPVRFREISANTHRIIKKAMDGMSPNGQPMTFNSEEEIQNFVAQTLGIQDPTQQAAIVQAIGQNNVGGSMAQPVPQDNMGAVNTGTPTGQDQNSGGFMQGVGLGKRAFQDLMTEAPIMTDSKQVAITEAVDQGLSFEEAYDHVQQTTGLPLTLAEFDMAGQQVANAEPSLVAAQIAEKLIAQAERKIATNLHVTADEVERDYDLEDLTFTEAYRWTNEYANTFNDNVDEGSGTVEAKRRALTAANNAVASYRVKLSLRDKSLVPIVDPDPEYSLAQQTKDSEPRFDMPYDETDGGISDYDDRNYSTMFKEKVESPNKDASVDGPFAKHSGKVWDALKKAWVDVKDAAQEGHQLDADYANELNDKFNAEDQNSKQANFEAVRDPENARGWDTDDRDFGRSEFDDLQTGYEDKPTLEDLARTLEQTFGWDLRRSIDWMTTTPEGKEYVATQIGDEVEVDTLPSGFASRTKHAESTGIDNSPEEKGQNPMNYSRYKTMIQDYLRAGNIPPTKVDLHKLKDGIYTLEELKDLADSVKVSDSSAVYPTAHASTTNEQIRKGAEDKLADIFKEMPLEPVSSPGSPNPFKEGPDEDEEDDPHPNIDKFDENDDGEILEGGKGDSTTVSDFDPSELAKGIEVEMEHIKEDKALAEEIAKDHLTEIPDYYTRLNKMEDEAKADKVATDMPSLMAHLKSLADKKVQNESK